MKMHPSLRKHDSCTCCTLRFSKPSVINKTFSQSAGLICKNYDSKMLCGFQYMLVTPPTFLKWNKFYIPVEFVEVFLCEKCNPKRRSFE